MRVLVAGRVWGGGGGGGGRGKEVGGGGGSDCPEAGPEPKYVPTVFGRVRKLARSDFYFRYVCLSVCLSVRPHGTTRLPLNGLS